MHLVHHYTAVPSYDLGDVYSMQSKVHFRFNTRVVCLCMRLLVLSWELAEKHSRVQSEDCGGLLKMRVISTKWHL